MALGELLRQVLVCPCCRGPLELHEEAGEPHGGELHCLACRLAFPIRDDIPHLLPRSARPLPPPR